MDDSKIEIKEIQLYFHNYESLFYPTAQCNKLTSINNVLQIHTFGVVMFGNV